MGCLLSCNTQLYLRCASNVETFDFTFFLLVEAHFWGGGILLCYFRYGRLSWGCGGLSHNFSIKGRDPCAGAGGHLVHLLLEVGASLLGMGVYYVALLLEVGAPLLGWCGRGGIYLSY